MIWRIVAIVSIACVVIGTWWIDDWDRLSWWQRIPVALSVLAGGAVALFAVGFVLWWVGYWVVVGAVA